MTSRSRNWPASRRRKTPGVIGLEIAGHSQFSLPAGNPFQVADGAIVRLVDGYWVPARKEPRVYEHRVRTVPIPQAQTVTDDDPAVLVVIATPLVAGRERSVTDLVAALGGHVRLAMATLVPQNDVAGRRWQALERAGVKAYDLATGVPTARTADFLAYLIARIDARTLLWLGDPHPYRAWFDTWRAQAPDLRIASRCGDDPSTPLNEVDLWLPRTAGEAAALTARDAVFCQVGRSDPRGGQASLDAEARARAREAIDATLDDIVVSALGDLVDEARPQDFVLLADRLRDDPRFRLVLAGEGPLSDTVSDLCRMLPPNQLCRVADPAIGLEASDIVCRTGERAGDDAWLLAALAGSRPVVAAEVDDVATWIRDGPCGLVVPVGDLESLHAAVLALAAPDHRAALGARGPAAAKRAARTDPGDWPGVLTRLDGLR